MPCIAQRGRQPKYGPHHNRLMPGPSSPPSPPPPLSPVKAILGRPLLYPCCPALCARCRSACRAARPLWALSATPRTRPWCELFRFARFGPITEITNNDNGSGVNGCSHPPLFLPFQKCLVRAHFFEFYYSETQFLLCTNHVAQNFHPPRKQASFWSTL